MKQLILTAVIAICSSAAFAAPANLRCLTTPPVANANYMLTFNGQMDKVIVEQVNNSRRTIAKLVCSTNSSKQRNPDQMFIWTCSEPKLRDAGYSVVVRIGGIAGFSEADLKEVSFAGSKVISHLKCK